MRSPYLVWLVNELVPHFRASPGTALRDISDERALEHLARYFATNAEGQPLFTGSQFETFAGGGDGPTANEITAEDLIAVSTLAVHVPARAALAFLGDERERISGLLSELPVDWHLEELGTTEFESLNSADGPAQHLWDLLRNFERPWGVGPTTASKIIARKRPHLIPIYDSVVAARVGLKNSAGQWRIWSESLRANNQELSQRIERLRAESGQGHVSLLRTLDIVLWMDQRAGVPLDEGTEESPVAVGDDEPS